MFNYSLTILDTFVSIQISLGELYVLILLRTTLLALFRLSDSYLLANCLAGLQSIATVAENIDHYCSERLVTVLIRLSKKYLRLGSGRRSFDGILHSTTGNYERSIDN